jgi:ATP-dependent helicase/nuclease subunit B
VPEGALGTRLHRVLPRHGAALGHGALLGPRLATIQDWVLARSPFRRPLIGRHARELLLVEALARHRDLFGEADPWQLASALLALFDQLTLAETELPVELDGFIRRLDAAYGTGGACVAPLGFEARLVHTLWHAYHRQLDAEGLVDPLLQYREALGQRPMPDAGDYLYLLGLADLSAVERQWLRALVEDGRTRILVQGQRGPGGYAPEAPTEILLERLALACEPGSAIADPYARVLTTLYSKRDEPLQTRARNCAKGHPRSPFDGRLFVFQAEDAETHAEAIELQLRRWLLEGREQLGVVTDDRRLARRLRARLERAGVVLQDRVGWALSTTSAAAVLERWLETLEQDFEHQALLDVLKSPFCELGADPWRGLAVVHRLEQDIIRNERIARGLKRYQAHVRYRARRLPQWADATARPLLALLGTLERAAAPLAPLITSGSIPATRFMDGLQESLAALGIRAGLEADAAGQRLLEELSALRSALASRATQLSWSDWRTLLGATLERRYFRPDPAPTPVRLLSLEQSDLERFDALVIAGADREHLPGAPPGTPFFNEAVRRELGLDGWHETLVRRFHRYRCLLEAAPVVLITVQSAAEGEPLLASPWLEGLQTFHRLGWGRELGDNDLAGLLRRPETRLAAPDRFGRVPPPVMPRPRAPADLIPTAFSANRHQRLMDCPYRFFAADCLGLKAPEEITEALQKSDYGERVHLCLQAFHDHVPGLPGPFRGPITEPDRDQAIELLTAITRSVFKQDLEDNFLHRGWQQRWMRAIPAYVDWQILRNAQWRVAATETSEARPLTETLTLKGRIDRLDHGGDGYGIIDYKTGASPSQAEVEQGEAVQLPSYALLKDRTVRVEYLGLGRNDQVRSGACLEGEALEELTGAVRERLIGAHAELRDGAPLPAWGAPGICRYCEMQGLCRRPAWEETQPPGTEP